MIQATWKAHVQKRKFNIMRVCALIMQKWIRRHLAKKEAERRKHAVNVIRNFIQGKEIHYGNAYKTYIFVFRFHYT